MSELAPSPNDEKVPIIGEDDSITWVYVTDAYAKEYSGLTVEESWQE